MIFSSHNIFSHIKDSQKYFIVNLLTGNADILSSSEASTIKLYIEGKEIADQEFYKLLIDKKYIIDEKEEKMLYKSRYLDFIDSREDDEIQLFFVPTYACNFACSYCYQDEYVPQKSGLTTEVIDAFFKYIDQEFAARKKYITIFGGEPLLNSEKQKADISYFIDKANERKLDICIVSNGYTLKEYLPILKKARIREIQVTLDGTSELHNKRRFLKGGGKSFEKITEGIDICLENKIMVNLRMVIDKENIDNLVELAHFAQDKIWTKSPYFKTQLGRNYELHHCQSASSKLFSRVELYERLYDLTLKYPDILNFYKPAFSVSKFLSENEALPDPLYDSCPACKTEWAFDYTGHIYPCTATVGKSDESLGTFYPEISKNEIAIYEWEKRDVVNIEACKTCNLQLACGGGCGSVAKNKEGNTSASDCRPVKELLELGISRYISK